MSTQKKEIRFAAAELRKTATGSRTLAGYAAKFNEISLPIPGSDGWFIEKLAPGCFAQSLAAGEEIRALCDHEDTKIIGKRSNGSLRISEDNVGLRVEIDVPATSWGNDLLACVDSGLVSGMSFGAYMLEDRWEQTIYEGKPWALRTVLRADAFEVTATSMPAYPQTSLAAARSLYFPNGLPEFVERRTNVDLAAETEKRRHRVEAVIAQMDEEESARSMKRLRDRYTNLFS
jgi:HK97 family phage prohead protease